MRAVFAAMIALFLAGTALAEGLAAQARLDPAASQIADAGDGIAIELALSQPVPWRLRLLDGPPRLVLDAREVDWTRLGALVRSTARVRTVRAGILRPGWSRLVLELDGPYLVARAAMLTEDGARLEVRLDPAPAIDFAAAARQPDLPDWDLPDPGTRPPSPAGSGPLTVAIDPGHGGIDPGAESAGLAEADLMLAIARELKEALVRAGNTRVVLTREEDVFVPLEARVTIARAAAADIFISLHADALAEGDAAGATIYTLAAAASDEASEALAERHDRDDLLAGVDLSAQDDVIAKVLMDMARNDTAPRMHRLAAALEAAIRGAGLRMHRIPLQEAGFSVLKSPDIPSVLVELGFLSSAGDRTRLTDPAWRAQMVGALAAGIGAWAIEDAALQARLRP